ncbi:hypothetical protein [uncultured Zoogloea sp.]|uniref:hypothetical protein n=1 Tax=uncultured Zoogloea sp. TaxID=160237 RepID=UPI0026236FCF|nr:hypothetical protein [uncultured Zoogloea sp.]
MILWGTMPPAKIKAPTPTIPNSARHRVRMMRALRRLAVALEQLAEMVEFRFRSTEAGAVLRAHLEMIESIRSPAEARDILGELIEGHVAGAVRPPQLDSMLTETLTAMFEAADCADEQAWPAALLRAATLQSRMFDPYESAGAAITRLPTGTYVIALCDHVPMASQLNSVATSAEPETSRRVTRSSALKVSTANGSQSMTA